MENNRGSRRLYSHFSPTTKEVLAPKELIKALENYSVNKFNNQLEGLGLLTRVCSTPKKRKAEAIASWDHWRKSEGGDREGQY